MAGIATRRRSVTVAALVASVAAVGGSACGSDEPTPLEQLARARQVQARDAARRAGLDDRAVAFLVQAAGAVAARFSVTYELPDGSRGVLVQAPPERRVDLIAGPTEDAVVRSVIVNREGAFTCLRQEGRWSCAAAPAGEGEAELGPFSAAAIQDTVTSLAAARSTHVLRVERRTLVGEEASCLVSSPKPAADNATAGVLCISRAGAPLLVEGTDSDLRAVRYRTWAPASALRLPAAVPED